MTRYFFDTADGDNDTDETGVDLAGDEEAIAQAIRYAGSLIQHQPDILTSRHEFVVSVRRDGAGRFAAVRLQLTDG